MTLPFRCRCGALQGQIEPRQAYTRAICYCRDCQAFARALDRGDVLDAHGGTDIVPTLPSSVRFDEGVEHLACLSLSPRGLLRWYAACCDTPLGNTPRERKLPYVGIVANCIATPAERDAAFGTPRIALNTESANGAVKRTPLAAFVGVLRIMRGVIAARLLGRSRDNPFFVPGSDEPVREPRVLTRSERAQAEGRHDSARS